MPYIYVTSGADMRAAGPFQIFAFRDDGDNDLDRDRSCGHGRPVVVLPAGRLAVHAHLRPRRSPGQLRLHDRGRVPRHGAAGDGLRGASTTARPRRRVGRVFYGGTRLSLPNTKFAPVTPLACGRARYPCRSQFDSIVYALGAETGQAAYDLNADRRRRVPGLPRQPLVAISMQADPDPARGGSRLNLDEGLIKDGSGAASAARRAAHGDQRHRERASSRGSRASRRRRSATARRSASRAAADAEAVRGSGPRGSGPLAFGRGSVPGGGCPVSVQASLEVATGVTFRS